LRIDTDQNFNMGTIYLGIIHVFHKHNNNGL